MKTSFYVPGVLVIFFVLLFLAGFAYKQIAGGEKPKTAPSGQYTSFGRLPVPILTATPTPTPKGISLPPLIPGERGIKVPVLLYHYISDNPNKDDKVRTGLSTPPSVFESQLQLLAANGNTTITFDQLAAILAGTMPLPTKPVILTFDDGYMDFYTQAFPLLRKYNMKAVAFIPTGLIGGGAYMTWDQIEEISKTSLVVFGAHSVHHYSLPQVREEVLRNEVEESKQVLEKHVGYTINWFAYPYGIFNERVVEEVRHAGFIGAVTTLPGAWQYQSRFLYIPRYRVGTKLGKDFLFLVS